MLPESDGQDMTLLFLAAIGIAVAVGLFFLLAYLLKRLKRNSIEKAVLRRKELLRELDLLEKQFFKRQIDQPTFEKFFTEKQQELISTEAVIQNAIKKQTPEDDKVLEKIPAKKRHFAAELLTGKNNILREMEIAKYSFMKRKIDSKTYEQLMEKLQSQLVEVQAKIQTLETEQDVQNVMEGLRQKLRDIDALEEKKKQDREKEIADEIIDQLETAHYLK